MLSVSEKYLQDINADTRNMPYRLTLAGAIVLDKTKVPNMAIEEDVGSSEGVVIGSANSSTLTFTLKDADKIDYSGMLVEVESGLVLSNGTTEWLPLGKFWITDHSTSNDYKTVKFTCADGMYLMTGAYESKLTYPAHIKDVAYEIVSQAGVEFVEPASWPNVYVRRKPEGLTWRDAIGHVAGCCGSNARFNRNGKLEFVWYKDSGITINRETQYLDGLTKLNYKPLEVNFEITGQVETYAVTVISDGNGGITATPGQNIVEGDTVVLSVNPFSGYELASIIAVTDVGNEVTLYKNTEGGYTFIQPDSNVTVTVAFRTSAEGPFKFTVRGYDNGRVSTDENEYYNLDDMVLFYIYPDSGYVIDKIVTTPADLEIFPPLEGEEEYLFLMPQCDVTVNVYFKKEAELYRINRLIGTESGGYLNIQNASTQEYIWEAAENTRVSVGITLENGYVLDYFDSDVELTQIDTNKYVFNMPAREVSITAYFKFSEDESKEGLYSWLQMPQSPPTAKPYWAVFYNESETLPTCQKYYLVWFDSWKATARSDGEYTIQLNGYYYCGSKNKGHGSHEWDTSTWSGNGASGSTLERKAYVDRMIADWDDYYGPSEQYCLIASNIHLYYNSSIVFKNCANAIKEPQTSYLQGDMDVRERGTLTQWLCPDTFSTPAPASNWVILMPEGGLYMTLNEEGKYEAPLTSYPKSLIALFYDTIAIQNIGSILRDTDEELYLASFTNARWTYLRDSTLGWDDVTHELPEGAVIGLRNPLITTAPEDEYVDGSDYNFAGVLATSQTLYCGGSVFMYKNSCRICDCESAVATFSLRRSVSDAIAFEAEGLSVSTQGDTIIINGTNITAKTVGDTIEIAITEILPEKVTITYTNPLIYEKMISGINEVVQGITYTPARLKYRGNPALQAGDIVTVPDKDGVNHTILIMQQTMSFGGGMNGEISCPGKTEKTKTFSAVSPVSAQIKKEVQQSSAELEHRLAANNALVFNSLYKNIGDTESKIRSVAEFQTQQSATIAEIEQTATENSGKISLVVGQNGLVNEDGAVQGSVVIEAINGESTAKIKADRLDIEGKELNIKVDATNIQGQVTAEQINAEGLNVNNGAFSGVLYTERISLQNKEISVVPDAAGETTFIKITWHVGYTTYQNRQYVGAYATIEEPLDVDITNLTIAVRDVSLNGLYAQLKNTSNDSIYGSIRAGNTRSNDFRSVGYASDYDISKYSGTPSIVLSSSGVVVAVNNTFAPMEDSVYGLGTSSKKWSEIYSATSTINTSDEREKNSISNIPQKYSDLFYKLNPVIYKLNEGTSDRFHVGFIAQSVEKAMAECGIDSKDFAGFIKTPNGDDYSYALRYGEFIALSVLQIQKLNQKILELEARLEELENV